MSRTQLSDFTSQAKLGNELIDHCPQISRSPDTQVVGVVSLSESSDIRRLMKSRKTSLALVEVVKGVFSGRDSGYFALFFSLTSPL